MSLIAALRVSSDVDLKNYLGISGECFKVLLHLLKSQTEWRNIKIKRTISAEERGTENFRGFFLGGGAAVRIFEDLNFRIIK